MPIHKNKKKQFKHLGQVELDLKHKLLYLT